jgi:hypothetical protein
MGVKLEMNIANTKSNRMKLLILTIILLCNNWIYGQNIPVENTHKSLSFLDSTINNYDVFLSGEYHWDTNIVERKKSMVKYLVSRKWLNVMVLERDYSYGYWVNDFIKTGDTNHLKEILKDDFFMSYNGIQYVNDFEFYTWLRDFLVRNNYTLEVVGIDMASYWKGEKFLRSFLRFTQNDTILSDKLSAHMVDAENLLKQEKISIGNFKKWFKQTERAYVKMDHSNVPFGNLMFNIKQSKKWARGNPMKWRDIQIARNFTKYIEPNDNVYGQFGSGHVLLKQGSRMNYYNPFAAILNETPEYRNKILSIGLMSFNCTSSTECYHPKTGGNLFIPFLTQEEFGLIKSDLKVMPFNSYIEMKNVLPDVERYFQILRVEHY